MRVVVDANVALAAVAARGLCEAVITGDKDLLVLRKYGTAQIIAPRSFWEVNRTGNGVQ